MFGGQQATGSQHVAPVAATRLQRVDVEERAAVEREAGEEPVVQGALEHVGEPALAGHEQHPPVPHDARDRRARLAVGAVRRQLVGVADRLAEMARADAAREVRLRRRGVVPLREHRVEQLLVAGLGVEIGHAGGEVQGAHRVAHDGA